MYHKYLSLGVLLLLVSNLYCSDTILVDFIHLNQSIKSIASDSTGKIWLSGGKGLQYWNGNKFVVVEEIFHQYIYENNGKVSPFQDSPKTDSNYYPWHIYKDWKKFVYQQGRYISGAIDSEGRYWIAKDSDIYIFKIEERFTQKLHGKSTRGILKDNEDIYVITYSGIFKNDSIIDVGSKHAEGRISKVNNTLFFCAGELFSLDLSTQHFMKWPVKQLNPEFKERGVGYNKVEIYNDTLWAATNMGMCYATKDSFICNSFDLVIEDFYFEEKGILVATSNGLKKYHNGHYKNLGLSNIFCHAINKYKGKYYIATARGLYIWDGNYEFKKIGLKEGLTQEVCHSTIIDDYGFLWVSTSNGLNRIDLSTGVISNYLRHVEFNKRSYHKSIDTLFFGGVQGYFSLNPKDFIGDEKLQSKNPLLINIYVFGLTTFFLLITSLIIILRIRKKSKLKDEQLIFQKRNNIFLKIENYVFNHPNLHVLTVNHIAEHLSMSDRTLYRTCQEMGVKPGELLKDLKLEKSKSLVQSGKYNSFQEIALLIGYSEQYFLKLYKSQYGIDLRKYLKEED